MGKNKCKGKYSGRVGAYVKALRRLERSLCATLEAFGAVQSGPIFGKDLARLQGSVASWDVSRSVTDCVGYCLQARAVIGAVLQSERRHFHLRGSHRAARPSDRKEGETPSEGQKRGK